MQTNKTLLQKKYVRVIEAFAARANISVAQALDFFYHSLTYQAVSQGISDMHCRSAGYLAEELLEEWMQRD